MLRKFKQKARNEANEEILDQLKRKPHDDFRIKLIKCELLEKLVLDSLI